MVPASMYALTPSVTSATMVALRHLHGLLWNWGSPKSNRQSVPIMRWSFKVVTLDRDEETGCFGAPCCSAHLGKPLWEKLRQREVSCFVLRVISPTAILACRLNESTPGLLPYTTLGWDPDTYCRDLGRKHSSYTPHWVTGGLTGTKGTLPVPFFPRMDRRSLAGGSCQEDYSLCPYKSQPEPSHLQSLEGEQLVWYVWI